VRTPMAHDPKDSNGTPVAHCNPSAASTKREDVNAAARNSGPSEAHPTSTSGSRTGSTARARLGRMAAMNHGPGATALATAGMMGGSRQRWNGPG
jgi:hypothetical protein